MASPTALGIASVSEADPINPRSRSNRARQTPTGSRIRPLVRLPIRLSHTISPSTDAFRQRFYPEVSASGWNDWRWQLRNRICDLKSLERVIQLSDEERTTLGRMGERLPMGVTPYYASLMAPDNPADPIRRAAVPAGAEFQLGEGEADDPLGEEHDSPVPGLVHRYPDRVLFLVTNFCATYCRYCTRGRMVGQNGECHFTARYFQRAVDYIREHTEIRDVLLSGGDPLTMSDDRLKGLLTKLRDIPHVEFLRIGTKTPAVMPQRITPELTRMLRQFHPLFISIHFMHPAELTPETRQACERLADAGIPLGSQTVLLKGINDDVDTMRQLMHGLLKVRVRPYYLYQCDPIRGSSHFRTPVASGLRIINGLRGHTSGYAVPTFVIDAPGGGGKIPLIDNPVVGCEDGDLLLRNYEGRTFRYPDGRST